MCLEIRNKDTYQYFGDATFRCVPPTFRYYILYIISGFNLIIKSTRLLVYILIPNETEKTYLEMFQYLNNNFGFEPKLFTMDFNKASSKALKKIYLNIYLIKCFFHFIQTIWKHFIRYGLTKKNLIKNFLNYLLI